MLRSFRAMAMCGLVATVAGAAGGHRALEASPMSVQESGGTAAYLRRLGLGKKLTVYFVFSHEVPESLLNTGFYKRLGSLPQLDKVNGRLILLTVDGVAPGLEALKAAGVTVHGAGSFPTEHDGLPLKMGSVAVLDASGKILRSWFGFPKPEQQDEIVKFIEDVK
jgi:hypothetical protein